ncbi:MAG: hypothetical protein ACD_73C00287G0002 [uncultured bacterium]|nr:MAG: hypothetical protein ACD_73C00287G0002 [uncultured bacterium]
MGQLLTLLKMHVLMVRSLQRVNVMSAVMFQKLGMPGKIVVKMLPQRVLLILSQKERSL